jgi:hypothetical protein
MKNAGSFWNKLPEGTIWLIVTVRHGKIHHFKFGKLSISMDHGFHGELQQITRGLRKKKISHPPISDY